MRLAYIGGWMRSGTTLLGELVGSLRSALALGEVSGVWGEAGAGGRCSCGELIVECRTWAPAFGAVKEKHGLCPQDSPEFADVIRRVARTRSTSRLASLQGQPPKSWPTDVRRYVEVLGTMLETVRVESGAKLLVDSSKLPPGFLLEKLIDGCDVRVVHIVRDPRAVAHSENKTRHSGGFATGSPPGRSPLRSAIYWNGFNAAVAWHAKQTDGYMRLRYEDLTDDPSSHLDRIAGFLELEPNEWEARRQPDFGGSHIAVGNPSRFDGQVREIRRNSAWQHELSWKHRTVVSMATAPVRGVLHRQSRRRE